MLEQQLEKTVFKQVIVFNCYRCGTYLLHFSPFLQFSKPVLVTINPVTGPGSWPGCFHGAVRLTCTGNFFKKGLTAIITRKRGYKILFRAMKHFSILLIHYISRFKTKSIYVSYFIYIERNFLLNISNEL